MIGRDRRHRLRPHPARPRDDTGSAMLKVAFVAVILILGVGLAVEQGWIPDLGRGNQADTSPDDQVPPPSGPGLQLAEPAAPPSVLDRARVSPTFRAKDVAHALAKAVRNKDLGSHVAVDVSVLGSHRSAYAFGDPMVTPASTLKLLTSTAALQALGPDHRFSTTVVAGRARHSIVLVGGGDPLLTGATPTKAAAAATYPERASLQDLARKTASRLEDRGIRSVQLSYDVSLYSGPAVNPHWEPSYITDDVVSPIVPLWVDEGRKVDGFSARSADPAAEAGHRFARFLDRAGVKVTGQLAQGVARRHAHQLAAVESAPLAQIVQHVLELSDNEGAETLLRQTAIATGRPGSFKGGVKAVTKQLDQLGLDTRKLTMYDGSGLSRQDELPVSALTGVLQIAAQPANAPLRTVVSSLPVAGFTGSLADRFIEDAQAGLGSVRAKTGTLTEAGVHGLAGIVVTKKGTPLLFAAVADRVPLLKTLDARAQLDVIAADLAACPC